MSLDDWYEIILSAQNTLTRKALKFCDDTLYRGEYSLRSLSSFVDAYTAQHLLYDWKFEPGLKMDPFEMAQFRLEDFSTSKEFISYVAGMYQYCFML